MKRPVIIDNEGYMVYVDTWKYPDNEGRIKVIKGGKGRGPIIKAWLESYGLKMEKEEEAENPNKVIGFVSHPDHPDHLDLSIIIIMEAREVGETFKFESQEELDITLPTQPIRDAIGEAMANGLPITQSPKPILTQLLALGIKGLRIEETHDGYDVKFQVKNLETLI